MSDLKIGQKVIWRGDWGIAEPKEGIVRFIQKNDFNGSEDGYDVSEIPWDEVTDRNVIISLENGHWCWGYQISKFFNNLNNLFMKTFIQFLIRNNVNVEPLKGGNEIQLVDERKNLNSHIIEAFEVINKHDQKDKIVGFNIVEVDSFRNKENITHQNIFDL
jgi:hypothetical protein